MRYLIYNIFFTLFLTVASHGGCFISRNNQVLLIQQTTGLWAIPGGHRDNEESGQETAQRETLEESGYHVSVGEELLLIRGAFHIYRCKILPIPQKGIDKDEVRQVQWVSHEDIIKGLDWRFPDEAEHYKDWIV
jgi:8-oxo-dGTP pyrophosphatase MutT (NUDIX family)